jgi:hypothetical protein
MSFRQSEIEHWPMWKLRKILTSIRKALRYAHKPKKALGLNRLTIESLELDAEMILMELNRRKKNG